MVIVVANYQTDNNELVQYWNVFISSVTELDNANNRECPCNIETGGDIRGKELIA
jgi:hypothetical protein